MLWKMSIFIFGWAKLSGGGFLLRCAVELHLLTCSNNLRLSYNVEKKRNM